MGAETRDSHDKPFVLVVPGVSVYDPAMSDSLIPMGRLVEVGFTVNHRIPSQAKEDGFSLKQFPLLSQAAVSRVTIPSLDSGGTT